jgi:hypothetical protein
MAHFAELSREVKHKVWKEVYEVLSRGQISRGGYAADSSERAGAHSLSDIDEVQNLLWEHVLCNRRLGGEEFESLSECRAKVSLDLERGFGARDGLYNPVNNIGTFNDPQMYSGATIPVSISPFEATALYASGGLPAIIIDKKSKGILVNGITFKTYDEGFWTDERVDQLLRAADRTGFDEKVIAGLRDATLYGGSAVYPIFKRDGVGTFSGGWERLVKSGVVGKDCIDRWAQVDRWNMVYICKYDPSAADYLSPRSFYIPISGIELNSARCCILRLKQLPYWGAIRQLGWAVSDLEGYIRSIYAYYVMAMSMPIMAQQMSLLLYQMPLDALNAQIGVDQVEKMMGVNEEKIREWSILNPKAVNMVGEVKTIDRSFSGFEHFFDAGVTDLCARAELPRPLLFHTPSKGFADNTTESLLKESEMMRTRQKEVEPLLVNATRVLIAHTFGTGSEEWERKDDVYMSFDKPVVATDKDKAEIGARYSATVNSLKQAGVPTRDALVLSKQFFPSIRISVDILKSSEEAYERETRMAEESEGVKAGRAAPSKQEDDGIDMRGKTALNGKAAQMRGSSTTSQAKDGSFSRLMKRLKSVFGREVSAGQAALIAEELDDDGAA